MARGARIGLALVLLPGCATRGALEGPPRALRPPPADLASAEARFRAAPDELEARVWYGRRLGYEGRFEEAVAVFGQGLEHHPDEAELLRHRGHRYLSLRRFEEARADLERAARGIEGRPDRLEPDGAPNDFGIPRGTLHTNVWYHLGLAYHCLQRDAEAAQAFGQCLALATNDDFRVAAAYWRVAALFHLGEAERGCALAALYGTRELELMESFDYAELLRLYAGTSTRAVERLGADPADLSRATLTYGVALWHRMNDREAEARALLERLVASGTSSAFGRLAAEVELARLGP